MTDLQEWQVITGDCREAMAAMDVDSIDAIVTDPPYELGFMGKAWDGTGVAFNVATWQAAYRVLKPGGYLLAFGGTRTFHRMTVAIEDAGFEIRDCLSWIYGSGFPKSLDVSKAIDKKRDDRDDIVRITTFMADHAETRGITRADIDEHMGTSDMGGWWLSRLRHRCQVPKWDQWLQLKALLDFGDEMDAEVWRLNGRKGKPGEAWSEREVICTDTKARSTAGRSALPTMGAEVEYQTWDITAPATDASRQWDGWGTALKPAWEPIIMARKPFRGTVAANVMAHGTGAINVDGCRIGTTPEDAKAMDRANTPGSGTFVKAGTIYGGGQGIPPAGIPYDTTQGRWPANVVLDEDAAALLGGPSRFFYTAKASRSERNAGLEGTPIKNLNWSSGEQNPGSFQSDGTNRSAQNYHPTVKPISLMQWLVRMVTPPGGTVLDPFMGSGSTGIAVAREGFTFVGIELNPEYAEIARRRIQGDAPLFSMKEKP